MGAAIIAHAEPMPYKKYDLFQVNSLIKRRCNWATSPARMYLL